MTSPSSSRNQSDSGVDDQESLLTGAWPLLLAVCKHVTSWVKHRATRFVSSTPSKRFMGKMFCVSETENSAGGHESTSIGSSDCITKSGILVTVREETRPTLPADAYLRLTPLLLTWRVNMTWRWPNEENEMTIDDTQWVHSGYLHEELYFYPSLVCSFVWWNRSRFYSPIRLSNKSVNRRCRAEC